MKISLKSSEQILLAIFNHPPALFAVISGGRAEIEYLRVSLKMKLG